MTDMKLTHVVLKRKKKPSEKVISVWKVVEVVAVGKNPVVGYFHVFMRNTNWQQAKAENFRF